MDLKSISPEVATALIGALSGIVSGISSGYFTYRVGAKKLEKEHQLQDAAVRVAHLLLLHSKWSLRSFGVIRHHLGGFSDNELRQILVRSGSIRFRSKGGSELWGLLKRNMSRLGVTTINEDPSDYDESHLFK